MHRMRLIRRHPQLCPEHKTLFCKAFSTPPALFKALGEQPGFSVVSAKMHTPARCLRAQGARLPRPPGTRRPWPEAPPRRTRRLLTDDGLLGGRRGRGQPEGPRCAQQQAQRVQQVSRARHGAGRLPPSFKGSVAGWPRAAAAAAIARPSGGWKASGGGGAPPRGLMGIVVPARKASSPAAAWL